MQFGLQGASSLLMRVMTHEPGADSEYRLPRIVGDGCGTRPLAHPAGLGPRTGPLGGSQELRAHVGPGSSTPRAPSLTRSSSGRRLARSSASSDTVLQRAVQWTRARLSPSSSGQRLRRAARGDAYGAGQLLPPLRGGICRSGRATYGAWLPDGAF